MKPINNGEYGLTLYFDLEEDVSANTTHEVILKDPCGVESIKTATLGDETLTGTDIGTLTVNEYVKYTLAEGDIDSFGRWMVRAISYDDSIKRKTNWMILSVKD